MAFADTDRRPRLPTVIAVTALHGIVGYALISGLAYSVIREMPVILKLIPIAAPDDPPPPPPPPVAQPRQEARPTTVDPVVVTTSTQPAIILPTQPVADILPRIDQPIALDPPPPAIDRTIAARPAGSRAAWITTDDYPAAAIRGGQEGVVDITVRIAASGRVEGCTVAVSSGSPVLDEATCRLYQRRARFTPALDSAGAAVATEYRDRVRWTLPQ